jgi:hypothetical protein
MQRDERAVLTPAEWGKLRHAVVGHLGLVVPQGTATDVSLYVFKRTLMFNKFSEIIRSKDFQFGSPHDAHCYSGLLVSRQMIHKAREALRVIGFLNWETVKYKRSKIPWHYFNIPGILDVVMEALVVTGNSSAVKGLPSIRKKSAEYFDKRGWGAPAVKVGEGLMPNMKERADEAKRRSKEAMEKKIRKAMMTPGNIKWILPRMREWAEEGGVTVSETPTKKMQGQMKNWLKECSAEGRDGVSVLRDACIHWREMRDYLEEQTFPNKYNLKGTVSFTEFYRHRLAIYAYLDEELPRHKEQLSNIVIIHEEL